MSKFFIEIQSNFHPTWRKSEAWNSGDGYQAGYETKEKAELWLNRARLSEMSNSSATTFKFRLATESEAIAAREANHG